MKVLSVNASVTGGGAERVARSLHEAYLARGVRSWLAVANVNADVPGVLRIPVDAGRSAWARAVLPYAWRLAGRSERPHDLRGLASRVVRVASEPGRWARVARGHEDFCFPWTPGLPDLPPEPADVLHLHNLHGGYFDIRALPHLSAAVPTVITLHDTWLMTGHCAQPRECGRWATGCGECPDLGRYVPIRRDASAANHALKHAAVTASRLGIAAPSQWLLDMAERSGLLGPERPGRVIPNGVDMTAFQPGERVRAREALGIPTDRHVIALSARGVTSDPQKGFTTLSEALRLLPESAVGRPLVLALGEAIPERCEGAAEVRGVGFLADARALATYLRAADVFVHPSWAENLPLAVLEAMACGTPVLATAVGGVPEVITDGVTGLLVRAGDPVQLAERLCELLDQPALRERLASAALGAVRSRYSLEKQAEAYLAWYAELAESFPAAGGRADR